MPTTALLDRLRSLASQKDKQQHFFVCFALTTLLLMSIGPELTFLVVSGIGLGKELWDHWYGSGFCWLDMLANCFGMAAGVLICLPFSV